jgi:hypothetical protein
MSHLKQLTTVVCSYTLSPTRIASILRDVGDRLHVRFHGVIVVNGNHGLVNVDTDWTLIKGSNTELDFSAYQEGIEWLACNLKCLPEVMLVINDSAFLKHHALDIIRNLLQYLQPVAECDVPAIAGKADKYDNICYQSPWSGLPIYLSTFCFLLNRSALPAIGNVLLKVDADLGNKLLDLDEPAWGIGLEKTFRTYLRCHLTYLHTSNTWYQLAEKRKNRRLISMKARAVYYEHRLSGDIGNNGVIINIYPTWRKQLRFFFYEQAAKLKRKFLLGER